MDCRGGVSRVSWGAWVGYGDRWCSSAEGVDEEPAARGRDTFVLADEVVVGLELDHVVPGLPCRPGDGLPVDDVVSHPHDDSEWGGDVADRGDDVQVGFGVGPGGQHAGGSEVDVRRRSRQQRRRRAEAVPEAADAGVPVGGPPVRVPGVLALAVPLVPRPVVEPQAGDAVVDEVVADGGQATVAAVTAGLRVGRGHDDAGVRLGIGRVECRLDPAGPRNEDGVGVHAWVLAGEDFKVADATGRMGILSRLSYAIRSKLSALVDRTADPTESLDYSYRQMQDELADVKRGVADLTAQKKRLEVQRDRLQENVDRHNEQAREAMRQDREDLARRALEKKQAKLAQIEDLEDQIASLQSTQHDLEEKKADLQSRVEAFKTKKETMKARYNAAEAQTRVSEAMTGVSGEMEDVNRAIERATDRTEEMEARAAAMDELSDRGVLEEGWSDEDVIDRELATGREEREIETELDTLRAEVEGDGSGGEVEEAVESEVDEAAVEAELDELKDEE